jgi:hypothetical protein
MRNRNYLTKISLLDLTSDPHRGTACGEVKVVGE